MNVIIAMYPDYDDRRYGTPWAAPCDINGRPNFKGETGHFTGGKGKGGTLYVTDPKPGSVWAFGVRDYKGPDTEKSYIQFREKGFRLLHGEDIPIALAEMAQRRIRRELCIRGLEKILQATTDEEDIKTIEEAIRLLDEYKRVSD